MKDILSRNFISHHGANNSVCTPLVMALNYQRIDIYADPQCMIPLPIYCLTTFILSIRKNITSQQSVVGNLKGLGSRKQYKEGLPPCKELPTASQISNTAQLGDPSTSAIHAVQCTTTEEQFCLAVLTDPTNVAHRVPLATVLLELDNRSGTRMEVFLEMCMCIEKTPMYSSLKCYIFRLNTGK